MFNKRCICWK